MAVIIDMEMPICCIDCGMEGGYCRHNHVWLLQNKKDKDCPLKSIDEMKEEIQESLDFWDYHNNNPLVRDILESIKKYCGEVDKNA